MKLAIGAGIGSLIAFVGLKNAAIVVANESTFVSLGNFSDPTVLLALFGILVTLLLVIKKVPAGVLSEWSLLPWSASLPVCFPYRRHAYTAAGIIYHDRFPYGGRRSIPERI